MYHGDRTHSGVGRNTPMPRALTVAKKVTLDGAAYASPLVIGGRVILATENNTVYSFNTHGGKLWSKHLGSPSPAAERPCGNISPLGITGTPIYSAANNRIYVVAGLTNPIRHVLYALGPKTGKVVWKKGLDLPGADARVMQQRGALAIAGGRVWASFGALAGDCGNYKGRVVGVRVSGKGAPVRYDPSPRPQGGIWNAAGPTVDSTGHLYVVSANGSSFPGDAYDHTNSVIELNPTGKRISSFAPSDWAQNNQGDVGLGSQGVAFVGSKWAVLGGKSGPVYVLRRGGHLGGIGGEVSQRNICRSFGGAAVIGSTVFLPCTDGVRAVQVSSAGELRVLWHAPNSIAGSPVYGGHRVWALDQNAGVLHALSAGRSLEHVSVGVTSRFATPALYGHLVVVPTMAGATFVRIS